MSAIKPEQRDVLLVIDVQNDFCPGGALEVPRGQEVVPVINDLITRFDHVILTQDWHPRGHSSFSSSHSGKEPFSEVAMPYGPQTLWPDHCIQGSRGAGFHDNLSWAKAEMVIRKGFRPDIDS
jgi:nicotinamidase/pyrazinamidase